MSLKLISLQYSDSCFYIKNQFFSYVHPFLLPIITPLQIAINSLLEIAQMGLLRVEITSRNISLFSFVFITISNIITCLKYHHYVFKTSNKILYDI